MQNTAPHLLLQVTCMWYSHTMSFKPHTVDMLKQKGLRATPKRAAILDALVNAHVPVSAEEIHVRVPTADLVTVYRALESLVGASLVREVRFKDSVVRYEMAEGYHHHHLVCTICGRVDELPHCDLAAIEKQALKTSKHFAEVKEHALEFFGTCVTCARR
jgi:Fur family transcriptional regulator, ferric uptake regulator